MIYLENGKYERHFRRYRCSVCPDAWCYQYLETQQPKKFKRWCEAHFHEPNIEQRELVEEINKKLTPQLRQIAKSLYYSIKEEKKKWQ